MTIIAILLQLTDLQVGVLSIGGVLTISREDVLTPMGYFTVCCEGENINRIRYDYLGGAVGGIISWTVDGTPTALTPTGFN